MRTYGRLVCVRCTHILSIKMHAKLQSLTKTVLIKWADLWIVILVVIACLELYESFYNLYLAKSSMDVYNVHATNILRL